MSGLTPQIASHKAMEKALLESASDCGDPMISSIMRELAIVHQKTWKALEAGEAALKLPMDGDSDGFSYDRGGKPPPGASER